MRKTPEYIIIDHRLLLIPVNSALTFLELLISTPMISRLTVLINICCTTEDIFSPLDILPPKANGMDIPTMNIKPGKTQSARPMPSKLAFV